MQQGGDDRAQSVQVGVIILFGFLIVAASAYQAFVVPQENAEIEFTDYRDSAADVMSLRNVMLSSAADDNVRGRTVSTGTQYPVRVFFVNPPPATGTVQTTETSNISVSGIRGQGGDTNLETYIAAESNSLEYRTNAVRYVPRYNAFDGAAPVVVENGVVYRAYDTPVVSTSQTLVDSNRIRLVTVGGDLRAEGLSAGLTVEPVSAHRRTVTVTNRSNSSFNITVPTELSESTWEGLLSDQIDPDDSSPDRYVRSVTKPEGSDHVNITMEGGAQYELQIARLELREESDPNREASPDARYLVADGENRTQTNREGRVKLVVEARDRYNNPVSNSVVTFDASEGTFERAEGSPADRNDTAEGAQIRTDDDGKAVVYFNATGNLGTIPVRAFLGTDDAASGERATRFRVFNNVIGGDGGGGTGEQAGRSLVVLNGTEPVSSSDSSLTLNVENLGTFDANVTGYRLDYSTGITSNGGLRDGATAITSVTFDGTRTVSGTAREASSPYFFGTNPYEFGQGDHTIRFDFDDSFAAGSGGGSPQGVFISIAIYLEGDLTVTFALQLTFS